MEWKVPNRTGRSARSLELSGAVLVDPDGCGDDDDGEVGGGGGGVGDGDGESEGACWVEDVMTR